MTDKVFRLGSAWMFTENPDEKEINCATETVAFDESTSISINGSFDSQVCILRKDSKYGIYTLGHANGRQNTGTYYSPTHNPFPYDEVKYFANLEECCAFFAFRIGNKWGILKVAGGFINQDEGLYDVEYNASKSRLLVPCQYVALEDAELQLQTSVNWQELFANIAPVVTDKVKRIVKKSPGRDKIRVTFPDGMVIENSVVWKTLAETIKRIGLERVEKLKIPGVEKRNILLVDTHPTTDIIYKKLQKSIAPGYYLLTYNNTEQKAIYLERISDELHLNLKIELISYDQMKEV